MRSAGIDMGSSTVKLAVLEDNLLVRLEVVQAEGNPFAAAKSLLTLAVDCPIIVTGYGRDMLEAQFKCPAITEIKAHALGARFLFPECTTVVDVGGQDLKIISLDAKGHVARFEMNDRCAAGTGKFLEIMAARLGLSLAVFGKIALIGADTLTVSAMCTVFAESETIGLLNMGHPLPDISRALHKSAVKRIVSMFKRLSPSIECIVMTGGGARNPALLSLLETNLECSVFISESSQAAGAIGCALQAVTVL